MGLLHSKAACLKRKIDESTSNSSLSNLRYILNADKPKWNPFWKRKISPVQTFSATSRKLLKGCVCGNMRPCKQKITPKGVIMHYPKKKKAFTNFRRKKELASEKRGRNIKCHSVGMPYRIIQLISSAALYTK
ncbi:PREDICTED: uncharacterized protein LOC106108780 isoform X1 [Papilio polytes]|uniref:uncharacterized protein LOC106108780 isoform X1 n=1 Tax=Papilio polytes TaxID=76194 RepID=UPI0006768176|nr:PREDICTED: uncharacterized protein LOC106108780 isoform X1 [Papilio polytes]